MTTQFLRSLDGIFYSLLAFAGLVLYESFGVVTLWAKPSIYTALPLAALFGATLFLPDNGRWPDALSATVHNLKILALALVGCYPFIPWHASGTTSIGLAAGAGAACFFGTLYLLELLKLLGMMFAMCHKQELHKLTRQLRIAMSYVVLTPAATVYGLVIFQMTRHKIAPTRLLKYAWDNLNPAVRLGGLLFAAVSAVLLLFLLQRSRAYAPTFMEKLEKE